MFCLLSVPSFLYNVGVGSWGPRFCGPPQSFFIKGAAASIAEAKHRTPLNVPQKMVPLLCQQHFAPPAIQVDLALPAKTSLDTIS